MVYIPDNHGNMYTVFLYVQNLIEGNQSSFFFFLILFFGFSFISVYYRLKRTNLIGLRPRHYL